MGVNVHSQNIFNFGGCINIQYPETFEVTKDTFIVEEERWECRLAFKSHPVYWADFEMVQWNEGVNSKSSEKLQAIVDDVYSKFDHTYGEELRLASNGDEISYYDFGDASVTQMGSADYGDEAIIVEISSIILGDRLIIAKLIKPFLLYFKYDNDMWRIVKSLEYINSKN